jgi:manganese/iron transport system substrate-binding protein
MKFFRKRLMLSFIIIAVGLLLSACSAGAAQKVPAVSPTTDEQDGDNGEGGEQVHGAGAEMIRLPDLEAVKLDGERLRVVATTSIIGDVVAQVGGEAIELTTLMGPGQDPHSYEPGAQELTAVAEAQVIFVNGWDLEEGLVQDLEEIGGAVPLVPISANIAPLTFGEGEHAPNRSAQEGEAERGPGDVDPHVWFSIPNVKQWVENVERVLSDLDPANAGNYESNAATYLAELEGLETYVESQLAQIPEENRFLVTNHDSLGYLAKEYGFELIGTLIPAASTLAEPSASDLAGLIGEMEAHGVCTIFTETTVSDRLAQTVAGELEGCEEVQVLKLYTGAVGPAGSGADSYIGMFHADIDRIVEGLK